MVSFQDWIYSFWIVLIKPIPKTFKTISEDIKDIVGSSIAWISFIVVVFYLILSLLGYYRGMALFTNLLNAVILMPIFVLLFVYLVHHFNQSLFHGENYCYDELLFTTVVIFVVSNLINLVPIIFQIDFRLLNWVLIIYPIGLIIVSVNTITNGKLWQSIVNVGLSLAISLIGIIVIGVFLGRFIQLVPHSFDGFWFYY